MRFKRTTCPTSRAVKSAAGFTLTEVMAAMLFMAIVIPVAVQGLRIASAAGQVGRCKAVAARIADRMLNEMVVTSQGTQSAQSGGSVQEGNQVYNWTSNSQTWSEDSMQQFTVQVTYQVQGQDYEVHLSTLVDTSLQQ